MIRLVNRISFICKISRYDRVFMYTTSSYIKYHQLGWDTVLHVRLAKTQISCTSAQSDQSLRCPHKDALDPWQPKESPVMTMIRLP